jgi:hypothetical protein
MSFYDDDAPKDLLKGQEYSSREISLYAQLNSRVRLISNERININSDKKYKVLQNFEGYLSKNTNGSFQPEGLVKIIYLESIPF